MKKISKLPVLGLIALAIVVGVLSSSSPHAYPIVAGTTPIPIISGKPRWDCPTPPIPTVASLLGTTVPMTDSLLYPTATPYYRSDFFFLGQDAYSAGMRTTIHNVRTVTDEQGTRQIITLEIAVMQAMPVDFMQQIVVREVRTADGRGQRGFWHGSIQAQQGLPPVPTALSAGQEWRGDIAIFTPAGTASTVFVYRTLTDRVLSDAPVDGVLVFNTTGVDPFCTDNVARIPLNPHVPGGTPGTMNGTPVAVPPGSNALVAFAIAHLGYPYGWGSKGPNAFDCSGLVYAAYQSIGIAIPMGTRGGPPPGQGFYGTPLNTSELRPGDLLFFATVAGPEQPSHVGMFVGDLNGNGSGDMIHSLWYDTGVIFTDDVFGNRYYASTFWGARRMPGFPY